MRPCRGRNRTQVRNWGLVLAEKTLARRRTWQRIGTGYSAPGPLAQSHASPACGRSHHAGRVPGDSRTAGAAAECMARPAVPRQRMQEMAHAGDGMQKMAHAADGMLLARRCHKLCMLLTVHAMCCACC
eukprot:358289-Chlamydomonas_euryale.AAC.4